MLNPEHWTSLSLLPAQCVRVEVVVHQLPDRSVACWAYEVSNPHDSTLIAKHVQPYVRPDEGLGADLGVSEALAVVLRAVLDPDPF